MRVAATPVAAMLLGQLLLVTLGPKKLMLSVCFGHNDECSSVGGHFQKTTAFLSHVASSTKRGV